MYNLNDPADLFTLLPQEMEIAEVKALCDNLDGKTKKEMVIEIIDQIAKENSIVLDKNLLGVFIDTIITASKGHYALNKVKND